MLIRNFSKCFVNSKLLLFKTYCISLYTAHLWSTFTNAAMRKLTFAYHGVLKMLLNVPRYHSNTTLFVNVGIPTFQELLRKTVFGFKSRIECSNNLLIRHINTSDVENPSTLMQFWRKLLYV